MELLDLREHVLRVIGNNLYYEGYDVLTLFNNTGGVTPIRSLKITFWPFWVVIDNLTAPQQSSFSNLLLVVLWKGIYIVA